MKLYVSTPCFGGMIETKTAAMIMHALDRAMSEGIISDYVLNFAGDSLISRIRNIHAMEALKENCDKIITIDADIDFTWEDFKRIITSKHDIIGGSYPLKCYPIVVNFNPIVGRGTEFLKTDRGYDLEAFELFRNKYADEKGIAEVLHLPTGFLCTKVDVLKRLSSTVKTYVSFSQELSQRHGYYHFYPSEVLDNQLLSEDWYFCVLARSAGYQIMFDTNVICGHIGKTTYRLGQIFGTVDLSAKEGKV